MKKMLVFKPEFLLMINYKGMHRYLNLIHSNNLTFQTYAILLNYTRTELSISFRRSTFFCSGQ